MCIFCCCFLCVSNSQVLCVYCFLCVFVYTYHSGAWKSLFVFMCIRFSSVLLCFPPFLQTYFYVYTAFFVGFNTIHIKISARAVFWNFPWGMGSICSTAALVARGRPARIRQQLFPAPSIFPRPVDSLCGGWNL